MVHKQSVVRLQVRVAKYHFLWSSCTQSLYKNSCAHKSKKLYLFCGKNWLADQLIQTRCTNLQKLAVSVLDGWPETNMQKSLSWDRKNMKVYASLEPLLGMHKKNTTSKIKLFNSLGGNKTSNAGYYASIFRSLHPCIRRGKLNSQFIIFILHAGGRSLFRFQMSIL